MRVGDLFRRLRRRYARRVRFSIRGRILDTSTGRERRAEVEWRDPKAERVTRRLVGDPYVVSRAEFLAFERARLPLTATGPEIEADLEDPALALVTIGSLFLPGYEVDGDVEPPEVEPLPPGAIA